MKSSCKGCTYSLLEVFLKFFFVYSIFGAVALFTIIINLLIIQVIETNSLVFIYKLEAGALSYEEIISFLIDGVIENVPFNSLFEVLIDGSGEIFSGIFGFLKDFNAEIISSSWNEYLPEFLRDFTLSSLAMLFFFIFSRLNALMKNFNDWAAQLAFIIVSVLWFFASYSSAECVLKLLEQVVLTENLNAAYYTVLIAAFLLHVLLLSFSDFGKGWGLKKGIKSNKGKEFSKRFLGRIHTLVRAFTILFLDLAFSMISAFALWSLHGYLYGLFNIFNVGISIFVFWCVALFLRLLQSLKEAITNILTYPLYMFFKSYES